MQKLSNWERLESVIKWANMSTNYFARHIGLLRGENLYQIKRGNNGISRNLADMVVKSFPEINLLWLLTGEGEMFNSDNMSGDGIPFYAFDVESNIRNIDNLKHNSIITLPQSIEADIAMLYTGRAMGGTILPNTIILLKKITPEMIIPGYEFVVLTKNIVTLRIVCFNDTTSSGVEYGEVLRLVSDNREKYSDILVNSSDLESVYRVTAKITIN